MTTAKKLLALVLALVLCLGILAGCDKNPAETKPAESGSAGNAGTAKLNTDIYPIDFDGTVKIVTGKADADKADNWVRWEEWTGVDAEWVTVSEEQTPLLFLDESQMPDMFFQAWGLTVPQTTWIRCPT